MINKVCCNKILKGTSIRKKMIMLVMLLEGTTRSRKAFQQGSHSLRNISLLLLCFKINENHETVTQTGTTTKKIPLKNVY